MPIFPHRVYFGCSGAIRGCAARGMRSISAPGGGDPRAPAVTVATRRVRRRHRLSASHTGRAHQRRASQLLARSSIGRGTLPEPIPHSDAPLHSQPPYAILRLVATSILILIVARFSP